MTSQRVAVVVLGDIGRSPRMQYQAFSLAMAGAAVDMIGYDGTPAFPTIAGHDRIRWYRMRGPWRPSPGGGRLLFLAAGVMKVITDSARLLWTLLAAIAKPDVVLVQNPPAIPTLFVTWIATRLRGARLVIDWHNFGHSMLALRLGKNHPLVAISRWYERVLGRRAEAHFCVSRAMQRLLERDWGIAAEVLYDCPPEWFRRLSADEREVVFHEFRELICPGAGRAETGNEWRPRLLISPTAWTADEDYSLLLEGVRQCDERLQNDSAFGRTAPDTAIVLLITGRGPLRAQFEAEIECLRLRYIAVRTLWVEPCDYPRLLGIADAGICVHHSASGVDLPMKIADMFGSGLPVLAFDYGPCLRERVQDGITGLYFRNAQELGQHLYDLFASLPRESPLLHALRSNVLNCAEHRWEDEWTVVARPLLLE